MTLAIPVMVYVSIQVMTIVPNSVPAVGWPFFWALVVVWLVALSVLSIKPVNVGVLRLAGARMPTQSEWWRLHGPWQQALVRSGSRPDRYLLLVTEDESPVHRDLGSYAVVVSWEWVCAVNDDELAGLLAQRLARQTNAVAPLVGLCVWAALPMALVLACGVLLYCIVRTVGKALGAAVDEVRPRTEGEAGCALLLLAVAFCLFVLSLIIGLTLLVVAVIAIVVCGVALWLARMADISSDNTAVRWGCGHQLWATLMRLDATGGDVTGWRRLISTRATVRAHIRRMQQSAMP